MYMNYVHDTICIYISAVISAKPAVHISCSENYSYILIYSRIEMKTIA